LWIQLWRAQAGRVSSVEIEREVAACVDDIAEVTTGGGVGDGVEVE
jgi:hypothetical protein